MKLKTIIAAAAAVVFAGNVAAQATSGSSLNETNGGSYIGATYCSRANRASTKYV